MKAPDWNKLDKERLAAAQREYDARVTDSDDLQEPVMQEVLNSYPCGCEVQPGEGLDRAYPYIRYCPLHAAAPALLEACEMGLERVAAEEKRTGSDYCRQIRESMEAAIAIALAEPT